VNIKIALKLSNQVEFALISLMGISAPIMSHIQQPHSIKAQQLPVVTPREFPLNRRAHLTSLANQVFPRRYWRKGQSTLIISTSKEGSTGRDAARMVSRMTRVGPRAIFKLEAPVGKGASNNEGINRERVVATRAAMPLVPDAKRHGRERQRGPACSWLARNGDEEADKAQRWE
jgi:hypothetical protein